MHVAALNKTPSWAIVIVVGFNIPNSRLPYNLFTYTGPAFNLFLQITNFKIGPFKVDSYTSPGVSVSMHFL